jgi:hypothetical protein
MSLEALGSKAVMPEDPAGNRPRADAPAVRRPFREVLRHSPLLAAPVVPPLRAPGHRIVERVGETVALLGAVPRVDAVYVPELLDENHEGRPRFRTYEPREYALHVMSRTGLPGIVTKVVAHLPNPRALETWVDRSLRDGITNFVLVGGSNSHTSYPGPSVEDSDRAIAPVVKAAGGVVGNIAIPQRRDEAARMLRKTEAGVSFFTTQLLFESGSIIDVLGQYARRCRAARVVPASVILSFASLADEDDIDFARWLGAQLPEDIEEALLQDEAALPKRSIELALGVWTSIQAATDQWGVPIGVSVEQVSSRQFGSARDLLKAFAEILPARPAAWEERTP